MATKRPLSLPPLAFERATAERETEKIPGSVPHSPPPPLFVQALRDAIRRERKDGGGGSLSVWGEKGGLATTTTTATTLPKKALLSRGGGGRSQSLRIWPAEEWGGRMGSSLRCCHCLGPRRRRRKRPTGQAKNRKCLDFPNLLLILSYKNMFMIIFQNTWYFSRLFGHRGEGTV